MKRRTLAIGAVLWACGGEPPAEDLEESIVAELSASKRLERASIIRGAAASRGLTNGALLAGIAGAETGMAHCWSEATWACQGPWSTSCGGPVIAGAGDGPCHIRQGGLGMFQFDGGDHDQTLARDGENILTVEGNVERAVGFAVDMVVRSRFVPEVTEAEGALAWLNAVPVAPGDPRYEAWISTVTHHYNGCPPGASCWNSRRAKYESLTRGVFWEMGGDEFWTVADAKDPEVPSCGTPYTPYGAIGDKWMKLGACDSFLGAPLTEELGTPDGAGRFNVFEHGSIYWTPWTGAWEVHGAIREYWASIGWERSWTGYPIADERTESHPDLGDVAISDFENGSIVFVFADGSVHTW